MVLSPSTSPIQRTVTLFTKFAARGHGRSGPREVADMEPIEAVGVARIGGLASNDDVGAVLGGENRNDPVLPDQSRIIARGQLEAAGVENRHVGVEKVRPSLIPSISTEIRSPFLALTA